MTLVLLLVASSLIGQESETTAGVDEALATKVQALVRQLNDNEQSKREAAERELIAIGPSVSPLLPAVSARTPAELKNRLTRVRNALVKAEVETATKPSMVTLHGEMLASEALAAISKQTGNKLIDYRERFNQQAADPKIKVDLENAPFWQAFDTVLDAANLTTYNYDEERGALAYTSRGDNAAPRLGRGSYSGLFRIEPKTIESTRDLRNSQMASLKLMVDAVWEPRIRPIVLEVPLGSLTAKDENGKDIGIDRSEGTLEVPVESSNTAVEVEFPLQAPSRNVKKLDALQGKATAVVLGKVESFEFADIDKAKSAELERGGVTVVVENCRKNGDVYEVNMRVRYDRAANALQSHRGWIYDNECYMIDSKGRRIKEHGLSDATLLAANEVGVSYKFDLEGQPPVGYKFVYKTPAAIIRIPIDFEIKGIDLP